MIRIADYPQLRLIAWNRPQDDVVDESEALALYERGWADVDTNALSNEEKILIKRLIKTHGNGCFCALF